MTFTEHTNSITAVLFLPTNHVVVSASLDGTVRAYDLVRYRNFKTFTTPTPTQFVSLAADQSGEVICAGSLDGFQVFCICLRINPLAGLLFMAYTSKLLSVSFHWSKCCARFVTSWM